MIFWQIFRSDLRSILSILLTFRSFIQNKGLLKFKQLMKKVWQSCIRSSLIENSLSLPRMKALVKLSLKMESYAEQNSSQMTVRSLMTGSNEKDEVKEASLWSIGLAVFSFKSRQCDEHQLLTWCIKAYYFI